MIMKTLQIPVSYLVSYPDLLVVHLTNVAIQKNSDNYDEKLGGKWDIRTLKLYLMSRYTLQKIPN